MRIMTVITDTSGIVGDGEVVGEVVGKQLEKPMVKLSVKELRRLFLELHFF
jgi:hypothetical protein